MDVSAFGSCLFLGARYHFILEELSNVTVQQYFAPYVAEIEAKGRRVVSLAEDVGGVFDTVFVLLPKNRVEAEYITAQGLRVLSPGGRIFCAADNKAGGTRIKKMLQEFGVSDLSDMSKNKARVVWGRANSIDQDAVLKALDGGAMCFCEKTGFFSQPGLYGWDKIDRGSEILLQHLPCDLRGRGADFGCGYGYLAQFVLQHCAGVKALACLEADARALLACRKNLEEYDGRVDFVQADLTRKIAVTNALDFIVMNPPFHEGKTSDFTLGMAFIVTAAQALKAGGALYMVANAHLPYEAALQQNFSVVDKVFEGQGFKVYKAVR